VDDASQAKVNTVNGGTHLTLLKNVAFSTLRDLFNQFTGWVQGVSGGNAVIISATGLMVKSTGSPAGILPAPQNMQAHYTNAAGMLKFTWNTVKGANSYVLQITQTPDDEDSWVYNQTVTRSKATVSGLNSAETYWGRVAAINAAGRSTWSDPAKNLVA